MTCLSHQLANGLTVIAECHPRNYTAALGVFVRAGSRDESLEVSGVSHFLEHMVFKGTSSRSADQVNIELDAMGSHSNARTSEDSTIYHAAVLPEFQTPITELFCDLMRPALRAEDFETEKKVVLEEILMYDDQPPYGGYERLMAEYFGDHPLSQSVLGTTQSIGELTPEQMRGYFQERYSPSNMAIAAAGNVDFDRLVADVERCAGSWTRSQPIRQIQPAAGRRGFHVLHKPQSTQQYLLQLSPGPSAEDPRRFAARLWAAILGDDSGSRMYWAFIDTGRAESAGMGNYEYEGTGLVMTYLCGAPEAAEENLHAVARLQAEAAEHGIGARELELAKSKMTADILIASERSENRMFGLGSNWLKGRPYLTPEELAARFQEVTLDDVHAVQAAFPMTASMTLVVGPRTDLAPA